MQLITFMTTALFLGFAAAQQQGATCFDAGDCILSGGGQCNKTTGQLLGTCGQAPASATGAAAANPLGALLSGGAGSGQATGSGAAVKARRTAIKVVY